MNITNFILLLTINILFGISTSSGRTEQFSIENNSQKLTPLVNGKIVYTETGDIWKMNAEGTQQVIITGSLPNLGQSYPDCQCDYSSVPVSISRRTVTSDGSAIYGVEVVLTDSDGFVRAARSNPFGYFRFDSVEVQQSYVVGFRHKQ